MNLKSLILGAILVCVSVFFVSGCSSDDDSSGPTYPFFSEGEWIGRTTDGLYVFFRVEDLEDKTVVTETIFKVEPSRIITKEHYDGIADVTNHSFSFVINATYTISGTFSPDSTMSGTCVYNDRTIDFTGFMKHGNSAPTAPIQISPESDETVWSHSLEFSWSPSNDYDGDEVVYDLFFGTSGYPPLIASNLSETSFSHVGNIDVSGTYHWRVSARDSYGNEVDSPLRSFQGEAFFDPGTPPANASHGDEWTALIGADEVPLEMIFVEAGSFMMGNQEDEYTRNGSEFPRHLITLSDGYWMAKYEFTKLQHQTLVPDASYNTNDLQEPAPYMRYDRVYNDIVPRLGDKWHLPTEAQWEYACRAGVDDAWYWWGNDEERLEDYAVYQFGHPFDVGTKEPNPWGFYDMLGNYAEICSDWYDPDYYEVSPEMDPQGPDTGNVKICRGGYYLYPAHLCRPAARDTVRGGYTCRLIRKAE